MSDGYSRGPKLVKGAIIQFTKALIAPVPNIIVFQYNPESLSRTITPFAPAGAPQKVPDSAKTADSTAQPQEPTETISLSLFLDATDALEEPKLHPQALVVGIADRLSAFEMLLYPTPRRPLLSEALDAVINHGASILDMFVEKQNVPVTLFVWGPGRIVPVRLQSYQVEEQQWNELLYPTRAKVTLGLKVLTADELASDTTTDAEGKSIAAHCYTWTQDQKRALAVANLANPVESLIGMLP